MVLLHNFAPHKIGNLHINCMIRWPTIDKQGLKPRRERPSVGHPARSSLCLTPRPTNLNPKPILPTPHLMYGRVTNLKAGKRSNSRRSSIQQVINPPRSKNFQRVFYQASRTKFCWVRQELVRRSRWPKSSNKRNGLPLSSPQTKPSRPNYTANSKAFFPKMPSSTSYPTTTITNPKHTSPVLTPTSKKKVR